MPVGFGAFSLTSGVPVLSSAAGSRGNTPGRFIAVPRKLGSGLTAWEQGGGGGGGGREKGDGRVDKRE